MPKDSRLKDMRRNTVFGGIALLIILADQLSKWWIKEHLALGQTLFDIGFFRIVHIYNTGAAFGIFRDHTLTLAIISCIGAAVILLIVIFGQGRWSFLDSLMVRSALGLVLGGTVGNLIDRLRPPHQVTDFIDFKVWPAFNVADSAVTIGVIILAYSILRLSQTSRH